jgi:hypothetical protein
MLILLFATDGLDLRIFPSGTGQLELTGIQLRAKQEGFFR